MVLNNIGTYKNGEYKNPILHSYYDKKCLSKPKMVALSGVIHKLYNIIFAVMRDNKPFEIILPELPFHHLSSFYFIVKVCFSILLSKLCIFCKLLLLSIDFS